MKTGIFMRLRFVMSCAEIESRFTVMCVFMSTVGIGAGVADGASASSTQSRRCCACSFRCELVEGAVLETWCELGGHGVGVVGSEAGWSTSSNHARAWRKVVKNSASFTWSLARCLIKGFKVLEAVGFLGDP